MNKVILYVVAFASLCLMMVGCSDETFNQESGNGTGYLRLALGSVNVELSSTSRADAGQLPADLIPETSDFMVDIKMNGKSVDGFPKPYTEITEDIELMAGSYSVIAYSGDNNEIQDKPYFYGSSTAQINPGQPTKTEVNAVLANAMITPSVSESLQNHYSEWSLSLKVGETSLKLADNEKTDGYLFAKAGTSVSAVFEGTNILGNEKSHEWTVISQAVACTKYLIQCDPDIPVFSFGLNAVAEHTTNDSGELNGTKVSLTFGDLSGVPVSLISELNVTLENAEGELVRSYSTNDFNSVGEMLVENNWPYLPQGDYTLRYSYTIDGEKVSEENTEAKIVSMPLPVFNAVASAQTSYSIYQSDGAAAANNTDGSSIFNVTATASISPEILGNDKYTNLLSVTYSLDTGESTTEESPVFENLKWGKRTLTAFVMFDKGSATSSVECDVTGIPYYVSFNGNTNPENWILSNNGKCGDRLTLKKGEAYALSPKFHIPMDLDVGVVLNAYAYGGSIPYDYKPTVSIHPSEVGINSTVITTLQGSIEVPGTASFHDISTMFTLTDKVGKICIYTRGNVTGWSVGTGDIGVVCDHFSVQYK
ncbi:DUF4493 domain-containing protein [Bacteroides caecigallinarum]|uniref:DUF4493 domain-containing protein n=1 Tax=Bacteroides caecigallinarum TaxID=1411144 RepID=UPI0019569035|nr:DUF4493 domain-containing protein [Bacteroides caecigallinarum]MBM6882864.1 DUF4493 domain-containing protein [Bacteroides caecigallinarum]